MLVGNGLVIMFIILIELLGLFGNFVNGINCVGIFIQSVVGFYVFFRGGKFDLLCSCWLILFIIIGVIGGVVVAVNVSNEVFCSVFCFLMIFMFIVIFVKLKCWLWEFDLSKQINFWIVVLFYFVLGFYGGFIQMGMGVFFLAVMVLYVWYSLVDVNVVKVFVVGVYIFFVILIF